MRVLAVCGWGRGFNTAGGGAVGGNPGMVRATGLPR